MDRDEVFVTTLPAPVRLFSVTDHGLAISSQAARTDDVPDGQCFIVFDG